jgi:putative redox protein
MTNSIQHFSCSSEAAIPKQWPNGSGPAVQTMMHDDEILAREGPPDKWSDSYSCSTTESKNGLFAYASVRHHDVVVDEPIQFGGNDTAPNPVEYVLAALGASLQVTARLFAIHWSLPIHSMKTKMDGRLDIRGFFATDDTVPAGLAQLSVRLTIVSSMDDPAFDRLAEQIRRACPVLGMLDQQPIELLIEKTDPNAADHNNSLAA